MSYVCNDCNYTTSLLANYKQHLKTKNIIKTLMNLFVNIVVNHSNIINRCIAILNTHVQKIKMRI